MKMFWRVVLVIVTLIVFVGGFVGATVAFDITQPSVSGSSQQIRFVVVKGDTTQSIANRLQQDGLIRNALLFRLWARYKHLDRGIEPGTYFLSAGMTMDQIVLKLQNGIPDVVNVTVPDPLRVTQYPAYLTNLPNFNAKTFLTITKTGIEPDGTKLWQKYWYVEKPQPNAVWALEGYLYPDTYELDRTADTTTVVETMLDELGYQLCPGPASNPNAYIFDKAQCKAHAISAGGQNIFTAMEQSYSTTDDTLALYNTLIIASLTAREINSYSDAIGVATVYHNRYLAFTGAVQSDTGGYMGSDPSAEYARDTDTPPTDGKWWTACATACTLIDPSSLYNTESPDISTSQPSANHPGLPPGPIAAPVLQEIVAAAAPQDESKFPYFYFVSDKCGKIYYATDNTDFVNNVEPKQYTGNC